MKSILALIVVTCAVAQAQEQTFSYSKRDGQIAFENAMTRIAMGPYMRVDKRTDVRTVTVDTSKLYLSIVKLSAGKIKRVTDANNNLLATVFLYGPEGTVNKIALPDGKEYLFSSYGPTVTYSSGTGKVVCKYDKDSNSFKVEASSTDGANVPLVVQVLAMEQGMSHVSSSKMPLGVSIGIGVLLAVIRLAASE